jgi:hypothetical protein
MNKLLLVLLGSAAVLLQTCLNFHDDFWYWFALIVSATSLVLSLLLLILARASSGKGQDFTHICAGILVIMWIVGTAFMTVKAPYTITGNGYFGAWVALIFSWLLAVEHYPSLRSPLDGLVENGGVLVATLTLASLVVFCQTLWLCIDRNGFDSGEVVWLFVCSGVSTLILLLLFIPAVSSNLKNSFNLVAIFLFVWWTIGWFIGTFDAPYFSTGNGFFGCWVALISSFLLADTAGGLSLRARGESATSKIPRALLAVTLGSIVVLVAVTYHGWSGNNGWWFWAFLCSCVSTCICVALCLALLVDTGKVSSLMQPVALFLMIWWIAGTGIMTFEQPFTATSNGYFGCWMAVAFSLILAHDNVPCMRDLLGKFGNYGRVLVLLFLVSATLSVQVVFDTADNSDFENAIIAWIVAAGSLTICLVMMLSQAREDVMRILMVIKFLLWCVGAGLLTFDGPYGHTGNAFFACWFGFALSALAVWRLYPDCVQKAVPDAGEPPAVVLGIQVA